LEDHFAWKLSKESQKANMVERPLTQKMLDYAAPMFFTCPNCATFLTRELVKLNRSNGWGSAMPCADRVRLIGFAPPDENDWRIGPQ